MQNSELISRAKAVEQQRQIIQETWQKFEQFVMPFSGKFFRPQNSETEMVWNQVQMYDTTAVDDSQLLAAQMHASVTNPAFKWFDIRFRNEQLNNDASAKRWLEESGKRTYAALQDSNFDLEIPEVYHELVVFGTAGISEEVEEDAGAFSGLNFRSIPIKELFFETDHEGKVLRLYRKLKWFPVQIQDKFGRDNLPEKIKQKVDSPGGLDSRETVWFCVWERDNYKTIDVSQPLNPDQRPFAHKYILEDGLITLGEEGGYYEMPVFLPRWRTSSGSIWGNSPTHNVFGTIMLCNALMHDMQKYVEKNVDPPFFTTKRNIVSDLNYDARTYTVVKDLDGIREMQVNGDFTSANVLLERAQEMIHRAYFLDRLELKESPAMTATEVMARTDRINQLLGPTAGRLRADLLDPLLQRSFNALYRAGQFEAPPDIILESEATMDIEYHGPLSRAQRSDEVQSAQIWVADLMDKAIQSQGELSEGLDRVNMDEYAKGTGQGLNVPARFVASDEEVMAKRERRAQAQQQQAAADNLPKVAKGVKDMADSGVLNGENVEQFPA